MTRFQRLPSMPHSISTEISSIQFSRSVMSDSLQPHRLQHARPLCPSPTSGVYSNSCPLSQWCHPTISSSAVPLQVAEWQVKTRCLHRLPLSRDLGSFPSPLLGQTSAALHPIPNANCSSLSRHWFSHHSTCFSYISLSYWYPRILLPWSWYLPLTRQLSEGRKVVSVFLVKAQSHKW